MNVTRTLDREGNRGAERVARHVGRHPERLQELLAGMESPAKRVKNAAAKAVRFLSEARPDLLAPHRERFERHLRGEDTILRWIAIDVIGNLAGANPDGAVDARTLRHLVALLADDSMVTASHAVDTLGKIASSHRARRARITTALASVPSRKSR